MTGGVQGSPGAAPGPQNGAAPAAGSSQVTKNMFLQLLVAQLKNQDPLNPADTTQFLTQLAQMQQLEQGLNMGQDIQAIRKTLETLASGAAGGEAANEA